MGLTKVTYAMIEGAVVNVLDYGAVGDGVADDTTAIQAAINAVAAQSPAGGTVYLPHGLYYITATLELTSESITLLGDGAGANHNTGASTTQDGATQIIGGHTTGPVIRIKHRGCQIKELVVSSNSTRRAATSGTNVYGIWVEATDTSAANSNDTPWRTTIDHVHVLKQPSHGIVIVGNVVNSIINAVDIDNCNGHGLVIDNGTITGRTNKYRPGQINIFSVRSSRTDGCALKVGNLADGTNNMPYRVNVNNLECFYNLQDPTTYNADGKQGAISGFMENCDFISCATGGEISAGVSDHNGMYIAGTYNVIRNHRFIDCEPYCAYIDDYGVSYRTTDIRFETLYINNANQPSGYYNPAVYVANANIRNIAVNANTYFGDVTSLLDISASQYAETYFQDRKQFAGVYSSNFKSWTTVFLNNNQAGYFTINPVRGRSGMIAVSGNISSAESGTASFRVGDANAFCTELSGSTNFATTTGALTGTTGTVGNLTISSDTATDRIYIENRTGALKAYTITNLCATGLITGFTLV